MMLDLHALDLHMPPSCGHKSLLGAQKPFTYKHLFDKAGRQSRPPTVRRGVMSMPCEAFDAPTADVDERTTDMASRVVGRMMTERTEAVGSILHAQCTLDQQMLGSTCMRLRYDHFPTVQRYATIGQLGVAGLPTALRLAACTPPSRTAAGTLTCVSAADKWIAPFVQNFPELLVFGDAAAACLVAPSRNASLSPAIAHVLDIEVSNRGLPYDLWTAPAAMQADAMLSQLEACATSVLSRTDCRRTDLVLIGDGTTASLGDRLAVRLGLVSMPPASPIHLSSASCLFSIGEAIRTATESGDPLDALVWTASPGGQAAVMLVRCRPDAIATATGWSAKS
jgi:hypothetical protein